MRVAPVHDYLMEMGGAERVVECLLEIFPGAPLYTSAYDPAACSPRFHEMNVRTTFVNRLTSRKMGTKALFPVLPFAFRSLDLRRFDVVLSSSSGFAHHVGTREDAVHVCYCHNPPRFLWQTEEYFRGRSGLGNVLSPALAALRRLDRQAARRVDAYVAISGTVAQRLRTTYGRAAEVIHPPIVVSRYRVSDERSGRFLVVSRLLPYKRIDLAVETASRLGLPLDVVGEGPDRPRLESMAGNSVRFFGWQPDSHVRRAMATCAALIVPGREDFGLTPVEAQASGRPPVAFAAGGSLETINDGRTGFLFGEQTCESLADALERAQDIEIRAHDLRVAAARFDISVFEGRLKDFVNEQLGRKRASR